MTSSPPPTGIRSLIALAKRQRYLRFTSCRAFKLPAGSRMHQCSKCSKAHIRPSSCDFAYGTNLMFGVWPMFTSQVRTCTEQHTRAWKNLNGWHSPPSSTFLGARTLTASCERSFGARMLSWRWTHSGSWSDVRLYLGTALCLKHPKLSPVPLRTKKQTQQLKPYKP